ncbi:heterokaryon incompatibility protein-domain-containing protein [Leptodontidium sp. 2 PMI_412]|nr:heterokaryon incompatibility protein-domain-containing protein [Leptodontidium sp. 2 PMI_412]
MSFNTTDPTPSTTRMCDICSQIPFDAEDPPFGSYRGGRYEWPLGILDRIRRTTDCSLCRLIVLAVYETQRGWSGVLSGEITLEWMPFMGPGGGFQVTGSGWLGYGTTINFLDVTRARGWVTACESNHGDACNPRWDQSIGPFISGLDVLRLIDVVKGCLVELQGPCRYLALSYVWGGVNGVRLTSSTKASLMKEGALQTIRHILPRTVQDAIELVNALDERFLWVDALCLVQNDTVDMRSGIEVMDLIYEKASLCIIAASGDTANAGLPGVRWGSRLVTNHAEQIQPGIKLAVYNELDRILRPLAYNRRGWTFQEQYLSRRALYFTDDQVYFRCKESTWSENCVDQLPKPNNIYFHTTLLPEVWKMKPEVEYRTILLYYTPRALTNQADTLLVMAGIIRRLSSKMRSRFSQGVPAAAFDTFMIFSAHDSLLRRRQGFPSYSWCGWIGQVNFYDPINENCWLFHKTWIIWYKRSSSGSVNLVWDITANETFPTANMDFVGYRHRLPFGSRHGLKFSTSRTTPTHEFYFEREFPPYPILQFWTLAVYFTISDFEVFSASASIQDKFGTPCGRIEMNGFEETTFFETSGPLEFILLSDWDYPRSKGWKFRDKGNSNYPANSAELPCYHVLLLEWIGGIAERRGLGVIYQNAVERSFTPGPVWKEIFLA